MQREVNFLSRKLKKKLKQIHTSSLVKTKSVTSISYFLIREELWPLNLSFSWHKDVKGRKNTSLVTKSHQLLKSLRFLDVDFNERNYKFMRSWHRQIVSIVGVIFFLNKWYKSKSSEIRLFHRSIRFGKINWNSCDVAFWPSMLALPIIAKQNSPSDGVFTHQ